MRSLLTLRDKRNKDLDTPRHMHFAEPPSSSSSKEVNSQDKSASGNEVSHQSYVHENTQQNEPQSEQLEKQIVESWCI